VFKVVAIIWWLSGLIIFSLVAAHGGSSAWVGIILCAILLVLSIVDARWNWDNSKDPHDWSV